MLEEIVFLYLQMHGYLSEAERAFGEIAAWFPCLKNIQTSNKLNLKWKMNHKLAIYNAKCFWFLLQLQYIN